MESKLVIGVDIGGTFTDCTVHEANGVIHVGKVPTTPDDPSRSFFSSIEEAFRPLDLCTPPARTGDVAVVGDVDTVSGTLGIGRDGDDRWWCSTARSRALAPLDHRWGEGAALAARN
jgi:predicted NBD/HSP70 family sugar kinase